MDWIKKHADSAAVLSGIVVAVCWMNGKFNDANKELSDFKTDVTKQFCEIKNDVNNLRTDLAVVKTALIIRGVLPSTEISCNSTKNNEAGL